MPTTLFWLRVFLILVLLPVAQLFLSMLALVVLILFVQGGFQ